MSTTTAPQGKAEEISDAARKAYAEIVEAYGADRAHEMVTVVSGDAKAEAFKTDYKRTNTQ